MYISYLLLALFVFLGFERLNIGVGKITSFILNLWLLQQDKSIEALIVVFGCQKSLNRQHCLKINEKSFGN